MKFVTVTFYFCIFKAIKLNYNTYDKKLSIVFKVFYIWHYYLEGLELFMDYKNLEYFLTTKILSVVATTRQNSPCDMLTSAKLSIGYLVVGITRELDKEPLLHCSSIYINYMWSVLQQYLLALMSMPLSHVLLLIHHVFILRLPCYIHVP